MNSSVSTLKYVIPKHQNPREPQNMGIKGLTKLLQQNAPSSIRHVDNMSAYRGKTIAFDASMHIYQFMTTIRVEKGELLQDASGNPTSHIQGMLSRITKLIENGISPVFVFDGKPPIEKQETLAKRREIRTANALKAIEATEQDDTASASTYQKRSYNLSEEEVRDCIRLLRILGIPVITAPCEAEAQCAYLCKEGLVDAVSTEDMDTLAFGTPILIRSLFSSNQPNRPGITEISLEKAISGLGLESVDHFIELCILCGCDYCGTIPGIGPVKALQKIKDFMNIDGVLASILKSQKLTHDKLKMFKYQDARRLFMTPPVTLSDDIKLEWGEIDKESLVSFLVGEKGFNEARLESYIKRMESSKRKRTQGSIDSFLDKMKRKN